MSMWPIPLNKNDQKLVESELEAILESDMVVIGPGSLFTSILPNLMIDEIGKAILKTKA